MPLFAAPAIVTPAVPSAVRMVVRADSKSGRLVRTPDAPKTTTPEETAELRAIADSIAEANGVEAPLVRSVILAESNYNAFAVSNKGAQGVMQLIPGTAKRFGVTNSFNAAENIEGGVKYLKFLLEYFHGDYTKAIAAYNAGEAAVDKFNGVPPYRETQGYVRTVAKHLTNERKATPAAAPQPVKPAEPAGPPPIHAVTGPDGKVYFTNQ